MGKHERWITAYDMVNASKNWTIPDDVGKNGGCCSRVRSYAFMRKKRERRRLSKENIRGSMIAYPRQFVNKCLSSRYKGVKFPELTYERAKEAILFFYSCQGDEDKGNFEVAKRIDTC